MKQPFLDESKFLEQIVGTIFEKRKHLDLIKCNAQTFSYLNQAQKKLVP